MNSQFLNSAVSSHNENALSNGINLQQARHPDFSNKSQRLFSYTRWTYSHIQDPTKLANYGFFYTEQGDLVRCYYCSLGLKDFIKTGDPLLEHVRYSGEKCGFLVQLLGPTRLSEIKKSIATETAFTQENTSVKRKLNTVTGETTGQASKQALTPAQPKVFSTHRHPKYILYSVRLSSYSGWPTHLVQTPQKLSAAGFFYLGTNDAVRCFSCDGGLQDWDFPEDPLIEHCVNFPHCLFLKETIGEDYIKLAIIHFNQPKVFVTPATFNPHNIAREFHNLQMSEVPIKGSQTEHLKGIDTLSEVGHKHAEIEPAIQALCKNKREKTVDSTIDEIEQNRNQVTETQTRKPKGQASKQALTPAPPKVFSTHRHPEYISYSVRLSSYSGWPTHLVQTPQKLSAAGFFYTGTHNVVRCFSCDGSLQRWDPTDDPWIKHCNNFPHCLFLKLPISHHYQSKVFATSNPHNIAREFHNLQIIEVPIKGSQTEHMKVIETLSEMGYKHAEIEPAIQALSKRSIPLQRNGKNFREITVDTTIDEIGQNRNQVTETQTRKPKDVLEEHKQLRLQLFCINCKTAYINSLFLPCQHYRFCTACAEDLTTCSVCGKGIARKIKTHRP